jgi:hypothetical protein
VSVATSPPPSGGIPAPPPPRAPAGEACPLCGAPLHPEQEWCLRCGAAARTRLAASPSWKGPIATLAVVVALAVGVLAASLIKLAGGSTAPTTTTTVTTSAAAIAPTPTTTLPSTALPGAGATGTTGSKAAGHAGATSPGAAGASSGLHVTSPRAGKSKRGKLGLSRKTEERLRKVGLLSGADTR